MMRHVGIWDPTRSPDRSGELKAAPKGELGLTPAPSDTTGNLISWDGRILMAASHRLEGSPYVVWSLFPPADRSEVRLTTIVAGFLATGVGLLLLFVLDRMVAQIQARRVHSAALMATNEALTTANEQLFALATVDPPTGCSNRRHFCERAAESLALARRSKQPRTLIVLDLDHFKRVNDTYGHPAGDAVLANTARACLELTRTSDVFGRIGGEEFALLLSDTGEGGAIVLAERLRAAIASLEVSRHSETIGVTASLGLA